MTSKDAMHDFGGAALFFGEDANGDTVAVAFDVPDHLIGTAFEGLSQSGEDFFLTTVDGQSFPLPHFDQEHFDRALACQQQFFVVGSLTDDSREPDHYPARLSKDVPSFGFGA